MNTSRKIGSAIGTGLIFILMSAAAFIFITGVNCFFYAWYMETLGGWSAMMIIMLICLALGGWMLHSISSVTSESMDEAAFGVAFALVAAIHYIEGSKVWLTFAIIFALVCFWNSLDKFLPRLSQTKVA